MISRKKKVETFPQFEEKTKKNRETKLQCNSLVSKLISRNILQFSKTHCGNCSIFLSLAFYMKSSIRDCRSSKTSDLTILRALNFGFYEFLQFLRAKLHIPKIEIQSL